MTRQQRELVIGVLEAELTDRFEGREPEPKVFVLGGLEDLFVVLGGYYGETLKSESPLHLPRSTDLLFRRLSDRLEFEDQAGDLGLADGAVGRGA